MRASISSATPERSRSRPNIFIENARAFMWKPHEFLQALYGLGIRQKVHGAIVARPRSSQFQFIIVVVSENTNRQILNGLFAGIGGTLLGLAGLAMVPRVDGGPVAKWVAGLGMLALIVGSLPVVSGSVKALVAKDRPD